MDATYTVSEDLATDVHAGLFGIGSSPGESVFVKEGASTIEPETAEDDNRYLDDSEDRFDQLLSQRVYLL